MSVPTARSAIESLRSLTPRLNAATDLANKTVRDAEEFLNEECSAGIPACVQFRSSENGPGYFLEYKRIGQRFRIAVVQATDEGRELSVRPWSDCTRDEKLESFKKLPELLARIAKDVETMVNEAESTAKAVAASLAGLRKNAEQQRS
jgi:hypothetical protein